MYMQCSVGFFNGFLRQWYHANLNMLWDRHIFFLHPKKHSLLIWILKFICQVDFNVSFELSFFKCITISWKIWIFFIVVNNWNFLTKYLFNKYFWGFLFFVFIGILVSSATRKEPAVICYRVCQGLGLCIVFFSAIALSLLYKVCLIGGTLVLGVIGYLVMEVSNNPVTPQENRAFDV